jgi:hypothetical protein
MGLLDENISNIPAQKCPRCEDGVVVKDKWGNISCTFCPLKISFGGKVRGWSLEKTIKIHKRKKKKGLPVV